MILRTIILVSYTPIISAHMYVSLRTDVCIRLYVLTFIHTCGHTRYIHTLYMYTYTSYMYIPTYVCTYIHTWAIYTYIHTYIHMPTYTYTHMFVCMCTYIHTCIIIHACILSFSPFLTISLCRAGLYFSHPVFSILCHVFSQLVFLHVSLYVVHPSLFQSASSPSPRNL